MGLVYPSATIRDLNVKPEMKTMAQQDQVSRKLLCLRRLQNILLTTMEVQKYCLSNLTKAMYKEWDKQRNPKYSTPIQSAVQ